MAPARFTRHGKLFLVPLLQDVLLEHLPLLRLLQLATGGLDHQGTVDHVLERLAGDLVKLFATEGRVLLLRLLLGPDAVLDGLLQLVKGDDGITDPRRNAGGGLTG